MVVASVEGQEGGYVQDLKGCSSYGNSWKRREVVFDGRVGKGHGRIEGSVG